MDGSLLEVGWVTRVHGVKGDVIVHPLSNIAGRFEEGLVVTLSKSGKVQERTLLRAKPYGHDLLCHLQGVDTREAAEALKGSALLAAPVDYGEDLLIHELIGASVIEADGTPRGSVLSVQANPASDLLLTDEDSLIPLVFVSNFDRESKVVTVTVPEGLFDL